LSHGQRRPQIRIVYSFVNRQGQQMSDFARLDGLWLQYRLEREAEPQRIEQLSAEPRRQGWFEAGGIGVELRWFWRFTEGVRGPAGRDRPVGAVPRDSAAAEHLQGRREDARDDSVVWRGEPLGTPGSPKVCGGSAEMVHARDEGAGTFGRVVTGGVRPEHWPLVERYDSVADGVPTRCSQKRDRGFQFQDRRYDEYGMLNFGDAMHKLVTNDWRPDFGSTGRPVLRFPHALFLHFFRTGKSLVPDGGGSGGAPGGRGHLA
jgi:hypothetical protein